VILPVVTGPDSPILRNGTKRVAKVTKELQKLFKDMRDTMVAEVGVGIAAPQVGSDLRICLAKIDGRVTTLVNPEITFRSARKETDEEGCLSCPGFQVAVPRSTEIIVRYQDGRGQKQERKLLDYNARVVQHEVDHLDGVLIVDYLPVTQPLTNSASA
jgi:peptide deformylase